MKPIQSSTTNHHKLNETDIIERILSGEKELYEILVRRNNQKLYRVIRSYLKTDVEIEDAMQNTYVNAYTHLVQFKQTSTFATWLIRIGINEALARLKEKGKRPTLNQHIDSQHDRTFLQIADDAHVNPQNKMIHNETKQLVELAIDQLDLKYKTVYIMKEVEDMSLKEIATILDLTLANVKVRLHRSKEMLKDKLYSLSAQSDIFEFGFSRCDQLTERVMNLIP